VLDAYLNPVLREYVRRIEAALGDRCRLRLMTSSGGLASAGQFTGRDCILSGPAGGVIGFSRVAEQAGFPRAIGFDMGGTSTDVARYDGRYEYEFETMKAGVRVATPHLAIETVAAGGGSLCGFDGVQLFVGPESAGADPGPACYGRGGPLTVTDVNLALGRLLPAEFPFRLDRAAVEQRLNELCERIAASPLGRTYRPLELAEGFVELANANMVRAIRKVSIAKGYNPADYALVTFGGAGGQHACAIADALGMRSILAHPLAGVLSAYGIGLADVRRQSERPVLKPLSSETLAEIEGVFRELETELRGAIAAEGVDPAAIEPARRSLDLRYRGVEAPLHIPQPADGDYAAAYTTRHREVYGYCHQGRDIEIATLRVEVVGRTPNPPVPTPAEPPRRRVPSERTRFRSRGREQAAAVFRRANLHAGDTLSGPAILCEPTSTLVIDPGWQGRVTATGDVVLERSSVVSALAAPVNCDATAPPDLITLEIFNNQFASIAEQMGVTLQRTAISTNVKERLDFSCAIFDRDGNLVVNAPHIPVHLGAMGETVRAVIADNTDWQPGDVVVTNDPYRGGSHLPDVTVVTPVHAPGTGELLFITASRAHHAEIGGIFPGSVPPFSCNLAEEGVLIRNFRLVDRRRSRAEEFQELLLSGPYPSRRVEDNLADLAAQTAANQLGARLLLDLVARHGFPQVATCMSQIREAAALKMRRALARHGDGVYTRTDWLDDGSPIAVRISIAEEHATIDFTGTGPVLAGNLNANRAIVTAAVLYVFRCLIDEDIPLNSGVLEPLTLVLPSCLLNPPSAADPRDCPAIVGGNVESSQRVVDVLLGALGLAAASQGTMNNLTFGNERFGYYETICGGSGATALLPGADAVHTHMTNTRLTDVEVLEQRYPVRVQEFRIRTGSGGAGQHRGGDGVVRRLEFLAPLHVSMLSQRRGEYHPFGLSGGAPGATGRNLFQRGGEPDPQNVGGAFQLEAAPGDILEIATPGGGGFGCDAVVTLDTTARPLA
jgi:5-oxoprolinase (ATP-hydrolysing)